VPLVLLKAPQRCAKPASCRKGGLEYCYAFFSDLDPDDSIDSLGGCRWFTGGWALQEHIALHKLGFDRSLALRRTEGENSALVNHYIR
jgi:hypothetical protein